MRCLDIYRRRVSEDLRYALGVDEGRKRALLITATTTILAAGKLAQFDKPCLAFPAPDLFGSDLELEASRQNVRTER